MSGLWPCLVPHKAEDRRDPPQPPFRLSKQRECWRLLWLQGSAAISSVDASAAQAIPGVVAVLTAKDLPPGPRCLVKSMGIPDEPIFAGDSVHYYGQPVGLVVAQTRVGCCRRGYCLRAALLFFHPPVSLSPGEGVPPCRARMLFCVKPAA